MISRYMLLLLLPMFLVLGCKSKRDGAEGTKLKKKSSKYIFDKLDKYHLDADWFSGKSSIKFTQNDKTIKATAYIRMKEDSVIWAVVKKLGIEGGRLLVTTDSVFLINRLEKTYIAEPFSYVRDMVGLASSGDDLEDFRNLYDLILGNVVMRMNGKYNVSIEDNHYQLNQSDEILNSTYHVNGKNYTLEHMNLSQEQGTRTASCNYGDYKSLTGNRVFSYLRELNVQSDETGDLSVVLQFSKIKLDEPVSTKFSIPQNYERAK